MAERGMCLENTTPPLIAAARDGNITMVMQLLNQRHSLNVKDKDGLTALYWACCRGHDELSQFLINAGSDINTRANSGATALLAATDNGQEKCVRQLLKKNVDINTPNRRGDTPLHAAAYRGYVKILQLLMEAGANPFLKNSASMTALQEAHAQQQYQCVICLQQFMSIIPGLSESISLSTPTLASDTLYQPSKEESCKSWPYVSPSSISRLSHNTRQEQMYPSFLDKLNNTFDNKGSISRYTSNKPANFNNSSYSTLSKSITEPSKNEKTESLQNSSFHHTKSIDMLNVNNLSISEPAVEEVSKSLSCDRHSSTAELGCQDSDIKYNRSQSSLTSDEDNNEFDKLEFLKDTKIIRDGNIPDKIYENLQFTQKQDTLISDIFADKKLSPPVASSHTFSTPLSPVTPTSEICRSGKEKNIFQNVLPEVNSNDFVQELQAQIVHLQENAFISNTLIAQLRDMLIDVNKKNVELNTENVKLRSLLYNQDPFSCRTPGVSDYSTDMKNGSSLNRSHRLMKYLSETDKYPTKGRCAVESSDNEDIPS